MPTVTEIDWVVERISNSPQKPGGVGGTVVSVGGTVLSVGGTVLSVGPAENVGVTGVPGETVKLVSEPAMLTLLCVYMYRLNDCKLRV